MVSSTKTKKGKPQLEKEVSPKSNNDQGKNEHISQEDLKALILEDQLWQSVVVIVVLESQRLNDNLLSQLNNLPSHFTIITENHLLNIGERESPGARRKGSSKTHKRSISKSTKKTTKTKDAKPNNNDKKEGDNGKRSNDELYCAKICTLLKKYILELKNYDIREKNNADNSQLDDPISKDVINDVKGHETFVSTANCMIQRYIILWGFYDLNLLQECLNFNILIKAIIRIEEKCLSKRQTSVTEAKRKGRAKQSSDHLALEEYLSFVDRFNEKMQDNQFLEINKDVLFLNLTMKTTDDERKELKVNSSFELNILQILSEISSAWRKFTNYNECLQIQEVPEVNEIVTLDDAYLYTTLVSMVPPECITVPILVNSMLEQICWWDEHILSKIDETCEKSNLFIEDRAKNTCTADTMTLACNKTSMEELGFGNNGSSSITSSSETKTSLSAKITMKNITPVLIYEADKIRGKTFHLNLPEVNFQNTTREMLLSSPVYKLWLSYPSSLNSNSKWHNFQLQRFKKCAENCYFDSDELFVLYLHQSVMNVLISKPDKLSIRKDYCQLQSEGSDNCLFSSTRESVDDSTTSFVQAMISNILCRVFNAHITSTTPKSSTLSTNGTCVEAAEYMESELVGQRKSYEMKTTDSNQYSNVLHKKLKHRLDKLNKLQSFLLCGEFVDLFEIVNNDRKYVSTDNMKRYEFTQNLNITCMCQKIQNAYEYFINANYHYFPLTDNILLWFNNSTMKDLTFTEEIKGILETPLGFRDFYRYKIKGKINFEDISRSNSIDENAYDLNTENVSSNVSSQSFHSSHGSHTTVDKCAPSTVTNLGSLRVEHNESYEHFISPDSTKVTVKKTNYFSNQMNIAVSVNKNNTSLCYDFTPEATNNFIDLTMKMHNGISIHCHLTWPLPIEIKLDTIVNELDNPDTTEIKDESLLLVCDLCISLPSGLLIEVVPTKSCLGPFYIRQKYLLKGPTSGPIWDETHRCYLKNGTIIIFKSDSTVSILYNNGTIVKCSAFNWEKTVLENIPVKDETVKGLEENDVEYGKVKKMEEVVSGKSKLDVKGKIKEKKEDKKPESISTSRKKKENVSKSELTAKTNLNIEKYEPELEVYSYKITQHSVLSWEGSFTEFNQDVCKNTTKTYDLRMAFDKRNQELYLQRSDGMTSFFTPDKLSITYPDGSRITTYAVDCRELDIENEQLAVVELLRTQEPPEGVDGFTEVTEMDSSQESFEDTNVSYFSYKFKYSSESQIEIGKDNSLNEENFVYVETSYLLEHSNYARVKYECVDGIVETEITLPGNITVFLDKNGRFTIESDGNEKITLTDCKLLYEAQVIKESSQRSITTLHFKNVTERLTVCSQTVDSLCNVFSVDEKGQTSLMRNEADDCDSKSVLQTLVHPENIEQFFVLNRDLTGYEMTQRCGNYNDGTTKTIKTPIIKSNNDLFTVYAETPIFKNASEKLLMKYFEDNNLPTLIKMKDLLKLKEMPEIIWFYPNLSRTVELKSEENLHDSSEVIFKKCTPEIPQAMSISKYSRIKNNLDLSKWFSTAINKYMSISEIIVKNYLNHYPDEVRNEEIYAEGDFNKNQVLGANSYYLSDNLPTVIVLDDLIKDKDNVSIYSVSTSTSSRVTSLYERIKEVLQK